MSEGKNWSWAPLRRPVEVGENQFESSSWALKAPAWNFHEAVDRNLWKFNSQRSTCYGYKMYSGEEQGRLWWWFWGGAAATRVLICTLVVVPIGARHQQRRRSKTLNWQTKSSKDELHQKQRLLLLLWKLCSRNVFGKTLVESPLLFAIRWGKKALWASRSSAAKNTKKGVGGGACLSFPKKLARLNLKPDIKEHWQKMLRPSESFRKRARAVRKWIPAREASGLLSWWSAGSFPQNPDRRHLH